MKKLWAQLKPGERRGVAIIGLVVFIILNYFLVYPKFFEWSRNTNRMQVARTKLATFKQEAAHDPEYKRKIGQLQASDSAVPPEDQAFQFESTYRDRATENGVPILSNGRLQTRTNDDYFMEASMSITVQAPEKNLVEFLYSLGQNNSLMRVRDMSLRPDQNRYQLAATITIVANYQKKPPARQTKPTTVAKAQPPQVVPKPPTGLAPPAGAMPGPGGMRMPGVTNRGPNMISKTAAATNKLGQLNAKRP